MHQSSITELQRRWLDHISAADSYDGTIVEYAKTNHLNTKDIYQWKTLLTKRGFLTIGPEPEFTDFVSVQKQTTRL